MAKWRTVVGSKQRNAYRGSVERGVSPAITAACGRGGGMTPRLTDAPIKTTMTDGFIRAMRKGNADRKHRE